MLFFLWALLLVGVGSSAEIAHFPQGWRSSFIPTSAFSDELFGWNVRAEHGALHGRQLAVTGGANCDGNFIQKLISSSGTVLLYDAVNGYNAYQTCFWRIKPASPSGSITLFFDDLSLPPGGQVSRAALARAPLRGIARTRGVFFYSPFTHAPPFSRCRSLRPQHYVQVFSVSPTTGALTLLRQEPASFTSSSRPLPVTCACNEMVVKFRSTYDAGTAYAGLSASFSALPFSVEGIAPLSGPTSGGVTVTVTGVFKGHTGLRCEWTSSTAFTFIASEDITTTPDAEYPDTRVLCTLSPNLGAVAAAYEFQIAGTATGALTESVAALAAGAYYIYPDAELSSLSPSSGSYLDLITVNLASPISSTILPAAAADFRCRFGSVEVSATAAGPSALACAVPMPLGAGGTVALSIALNGVSYSPSSLPFTYAETYCDGATTVTTLTGNIADHTRESGGSSPYRPYSACSWHILPSAGLGSCRIALGFTMADLAAGADSVAVFDGANENAPLIQQYPTITADSLDRLAPVVSSECQLFVRFRTKLLTGRAGFAARFSGQSLGLIGVSPLLAGTSSKDTTILTLSGQFASVPLDATTVDCVFRRADGTTARSPASKASNSRMRCGSPVWLRPSAAVQELVSLTLEFGSSQSPPPALDFTLVLEPTVTSIRPASGPVGAVVTVFGSRFASTPALSCSFGSVRVPARFVSERELECIAPLPARADQGPSPVFELSVSNNAVFFPPSTQLFRYAVYCGSTALGPLELTTSVGTIVDHASASAGSKGPGTYLPLSLCYFSLNPDRATTVNLAFDRLSMGAPDTLMLTDGAGTTYDALALQALNAGIAPSFSAMPLPVTVQFSTWSQPLGEGFALSFSDPQYEQSSCPSGGALVGFTAFTTSTQNVPFSSTALDESWTFHKVVLAAEPTGNERTLVVTMDQLLTTDAIAAYSLERACPSQALFNASASVAANGLLSLFTCTGAAESTVYVGVLGRSGDGGAIPYELSWEASLIDQLTEVQSDMTLLLADGGALYAKVAKPSSPQLWTALKFTVEITTAGYTGAYVGQLGVNARSCGPLGQEHYRVAQPHPDSLAWEISIVEPPDAQACAGTGYGGVGAEWVVVFFPEPGVDGGGAAVQADVRLSVDYLSQTRGPVQSSGAIDSEVSIAPGQTHYFSLEGLAILDVQVSPCGWDADAAAFDCTILAQANGLSFDVRAQKNGNECFSSDTPSTTATESGGVYRLSACGAESNDASLRWVIAVKSSGVDYSVRYKLTALATNIQAVLDSEPMPISVPVSPGDVRYFKVDVPEGLELDVTLVIETDATAPLLTVVTTTGGCELASATGDQGEVEVVTGYRYAATTPSAQVYRISLQGCAAATYFFAVYLSTDLPATSYDFTVDFARRPREFNVTTAATLETSGHAILPGAMHTFLAHIDPSHSLTITLTQEVDATLLAGKSDVLDLWALPLAPINSTASALVCGNSSKAPDGRYELVLGTSLPSGTAITRTLTIAECDAGGVLIGVQSRNTLAGAFTGYKLLLETTTRSIDVSSASGVLQGTVTAAHGNTFEVQASARDISIAVRVIIPTSDENAGAETVSLQVQGQQTACAAVGNADAVENGILISDEWLFASTLCAAQATSALATYYLRVTGSPSVLSGTRPVSYEVEVVSEPQVDYGAVLSPDNPLSALFALSYGTWHYNFMTVPSGITSVTGQYQALFALTVVKTLSPADGISSLLDDFSLLQVYLQFGECPSQDSAPFAIAENGQVEIPDTFALVPGAKLYIGLRGDWQTAARYAFRLRPSFECIAGFISSNYSVACQPCAPGTVNPTVGASECTRCSIGEEQPESGQTACFKCGFGEFQALPGQPSCDLCPAGFEGKRRGAKECTKCEVGFYSQTRGSEACLACPEGTTTASEGASDRAECECIKGFYNEELLSGEVCVACPLGAECDGGSGLESMPYPTPGYFQVCQCCPQAVRSSRAIFFPTACIVHITVSSLWPVALCSCSARITFVPRHPWPMPCLLTDNLLLRSPDNCQQDWDESLLLAQTIVTGPEETQYFFLTRGVWPYLDITQQTPRYWGPDFFLPCTPAAACPGGKWWLNYAGPEAAFDTNDGYLSVQCAEGYSNPQGSKQCNRCASAYYRNVSNECVACTTSALQLVAMAIGLIVLAAAMYSVSKSGFNVGALAISINFFQVTSIFASFQITWPLNVRVLFRFFEAFQIGIDIAQPECVVPNIGYSEKWIFMMALPVIFLSLLCTILIVIHGHHAVLTRTRFSLWFKRKFPRLLRKPDKQRAPNDETRGEMIKRVTGALAASALYKVGTSMVQTSTRETREVVADSIINAFFMFLTLFYLAAVQKALEPFACFSTQFDDRGVPATRVMHADASIACDWDDPIWQYLAPAGMIAGVVYGIGIPGSILTFLYTGRFRLNVLKFGRKFGYLYRRYEREWYFWEVRQGCLISARCPLRRLLRVHCTGDPLVPWCHAHARR